MIEHRIPAFRAVDCRRCAVEPPPAAWRPSPPTAALPDHVVAPMRWPSTPIGLSGARGRQPSMTWATVLMTRLARNSRSPTPAPSTPSCQCARSQRMTRSQWAGGPVNARKQPRRWTRLPCKAPEARRCGSLPDPAGTGRTGGDDADDWLDFGVFVVTGTRWNSLRSILRGGGWGALK